MIRNIIVAVVVALFCLPLTARAVDAPAANAPATSETPRAFFVNIKNGDTVTSPVHIVFGITGMEIAPAGTDKPNTGHFHLYIDAPLTADQQRLPIPKDGSHLHFGEGQTEAMVHLEPGRHTLQLVMGDGNHVPHNPPVISDIINITVTE